MAGEHREVAHRHPLLRIGQARGIAECRILEADLLGALVEEVGEGEFGAGDPLRDHDGGVVARLDDHAAEQVLEADAGIELGEHRGAARRRAAGAPGMLGNGEFVVKGKAAMLQRVEDVFGDHHLRHRGGGRRLVGGLLEEHRPAVIVHQDRVLRLRVEGGLGHGRDGGEPDGKADGDPHQSKDVHVRFVPRAPPQR